MDVQIDFRNEDTNISCGFGCGVTGLNRHENGGGFSSYCVWIGDIEIFLTYRQFLVFKEAINETQGGGLF